MKKVSLSININSDLYNDAGLIADKAGLSLEGLVKVLLTSVVNSDGIPDQFLYNRQTYDDYIEQKVSESLNGKTISADEANKILGFNPENYKSER